MTTPSPRLDGGHTPGPWACERDLSHFDTLTTVVGGCSRKGYLSRELIVQVGGYAGPSEAEANARLIAAAPDLLAPAPDAAEILEHYASFIRTVKADNLEWHPYLPHIEQVAADLRAAISRAKGKDHA